MKTTMDREAATTFVKPFLGSDLGATPHPHGFNLYANLIHAISNHSGWWHDLETGEPLDRNVGEMLMLIVSEISEAMEADRKDLMDDKLPHRKGVEVELADAVIRIMDFAGAAGMDIGGAIVEKLEFNLRRADHKPENRIKEGGKKY